MPRFYFRFCDGDELPDDLGIELPDVQAARLEAIKGIRSFAADCAHRGIVPVSQWIEIEDEARKSVMSISFEKALKLE